MNQRLSDALLGGVAGVIGASGMTIVRMLAHRAGLIDQMVPQAVVQKLERGAGRRPAPGSSRVVDQALHLGYGAALGAAYSALIDRPRRSPRVGHAIGYGAAQWAFGSMVLLPVLGIARPAWRKGLAENAVDLAAHLTFSGVSAFVAGEFDRQAATSPRAGHPASPARVG
ncbi:MAG TPA: hypothetical protein VK698_18000 [Kofleriaceae bacterium]|nr:hypothetical protein [Kofleriaceae bacterium]